jgi:hypothetical protein
MIKYPAAIDTQTELPYVVDNVTPISGDLINNLRDAVVAMETELGVKPSGIYTNVRSRINALEITVGNLVINGGAVYGGDLISSSPVTQTVIGLQGRSLTDTEPEDGYLITWNALDSEWQPLPAPVSFSAGGDLFGTANNQTVIGLQGYSVDNTAPTDGYILTWEATSTSWKPLPAPVGFSAGGDLSGTASSQTVIGIQSREIDSVAPNDGEVLTWEQSSTSWKPLPVPVGFSAGGDLSGTESNQTVIALQGNAVSNDAPTDGYTLVWEQSTTSWKPKSSITISQLPYLDMVGFANTVNTDSGTFIDAATFELDLTDLLAGTKIVVLRVVAETTGPLMTIQLYNVTAGGVVAGSTITTSSTTPVSLNTSDLFSNLTSGQAIYKVQIKMDAGTVSDRVFLAYAALRIEWS